MTAETIGIWVSLGGLAIGVGTQLVRLGRVLERQKVHTERLQTHDQQIGDLTDSHGETKAAFEGLQGEIRGLRSTMGTLSDTLRESIKRLDRHMERG